MRINIDLSGDTPSITGDVQGLLVVIEAARRDLNAMAQALGASSEFKAEYGRLARELNTAAINVPRVNLMDRDPFSGVDVCKPTLMGREPFAARGTIKPAAATRYFYHPESDCLMRTEDGSHPGTDGLVEEIDAEEYERVLTLQTAALQPGAPAVADEFEDLLS